MVNSHLIQLIIRINVTQVTLFCLMKIGWYLLLFQIMLSRWCYILFKEPSCYRSIGYCLQRCWASYSIIKGAVSNYLYLKGKVLYEQGFIFGAAIGHKGIHIFYWSYVLSCSHYWLVLSNTAIYLNVTLLKEKHISYRNSEHYVTLQRKQTKEHTSLYLLFVK